MPSMKNRENLWELIDIADIAVRVASHLHQRKLGHISNDDESITKAIEFLEQAADGGNFMSTGHLKPETPTLRPLNWAVDIYETLGLQSSESTDYEKLAKYLNDILDCLITLHKSGDAKDSSEFDEPINFFDGLGKLLSSQINQQRANDSFQMNH